MSSVKNTRGLLGTKLGMTQTWDENNRVVPVTVIQAGPCVVTEVRTSDSHGYDGVQIAFGDIDPRKVNSPMRGHFEKAGVTPASPAGAAHRRRERVHAGPGDQGRGLRRR